MKKIDSIPSSGQFVAVWNYGGEIWSNTVKVEDGEYYIYHDGCDDWREDRNFVDSMEFLEEDGSSITYFVV